MLNAKCSVISILCSGAGEVAVPVLVAALCLSPVAHAGPCPAAGLAAHTGLGLSPGQGEHIYSRNASFVSQLGAESHGQLGLP